MVRSLQPCNFITRSPTCTTLGLGADDTMIHIMEIRANGDSEERHLKNHDFLQTLTEKKLPFRDLRMILKCPDKGGLTRYSSIIQYSPNETSVSYELASSPLSK